MMELVLDIFLFISFFLAGISFVLTAVSAAEAFVITKGRFNRNITYTDIYRSLKYSIIAPLNWLLDKPGTQMRLSTHSSLSYSYIGLFFSFLTSVLGIFIWFSFYRDAAQVHAITPLLICWYVSLTIKNIGINAFHLRLIIAQLEDGDI